MAKLVTIFGGSGFIGRYIARRMAKQGWRVRVAVRRPNEALFVKTYGVVGQVEPILCNIRDDASVEEALSGADAARLINRFCAVDLSCSKGKFLATALHHVPVHILKSSATAYLLFLPRSYAESLAELLYHSALQFGVDVKSVAEWSMKK